MNPDALALQQWLDRLDRNTRPKGMPLMRWALLALKVLHADNRSKDGACAALGRQVAELQRQLAEVKNALPDPLRPNDTAGHRAE